MRYIIRAESLEHMKQIELEVARFQRVIIRSRPGRFLVVRDPTKELIAYLDGQGLRHHAEAELEEELRLPPGMAIQILDAPPPKAMFEIVEEADFTDPTPVVRDGKTFYPVWT
jgi:hypothetical protein